MTQPSIQQIRSRGLVHGLPVLPDNLRGLTAIVAGANGISGASMVKVLAESPERWSKIYALSRHAPDQPWPAQVEALAIDLLSLSPDRIAAELEARGVRADYVFYCAYLQPPVAEGTALWRNAEALTDVNLQMLRNLLEALPLAGSLPKRILVQFGMKYYGVHLGPTNFPQEEADPRVGEEIEPNFYYAQHDVLKEFCDRHGIGWNDTRPGWILGAVPNAAMNIALPLGLYASLRRHLRQPLVFPGDIAAWDAPATNSSARLIGYLSEWAVLTEAARNQSFNASDDCAFTWGRLWQKLADWYGIAWQPPAEDPAAYHEVTSDQPPLRGFGPRGRMRFTFRFTDWARRPEVRRAWSEIAAADGLDMVELPDIDRTFGLLDYMFTARPQFLNLSKVKKLGFFGFVDSYECYLSVLEEFAAMKILPPVRRQTGAEDVARDDKGG